jgi:diacylglycerol kinase family enzyme
LADAPVRRIDVARVNGAPFLCASMLGMTTDLARTREAARGSGIWKAVPKFIQKGYWLLRRYPFRRVELMLDGDRITARTRAIVVSNNPIAPEPRLYPKRERLDSGRLGVYCVREGPLHELPLLVLSLLKGTWPEDPRIFSATSGHLMIRTPRPVRFTVLNDGERRRLTTPLHYELLPAALPVLAPEMTG